MTQQNKKRFVVTLQLEPDEFDLLKHLAKQETRSVSAQIMHLLRKSIEFVQSTSIHS